MNASAQSTGASVANVNMLKDGSVDLAFIQNDIAYYAVNGSEMFKDNKEAGLRGLAALYPETIQFVTTADKGIKSIADLKGKKVAVGAAGSGAEANARQILAAYGITYDDIDERFLSFGEAADALKDGNVDAGVVVAGFPTAAIQDLAANKSAAIINIDSDKADELMSEVLKMQDEFVTRISHTEPGNVKVFYKKFRADFNAKVNEIFEAIG